MPTDDLFAPITSTPELLDATGDRAWLQAMLDAEAALARAEASAGVIPAEAAEAIGRSRESTCSIRPSSGGRPGAGATR